MEPLDVAWLAGILEGEGSFLKGPPSAENQPRISIQMTDHDVVLRVSNLFDVQYICTTSDKRSPKWKTAFRTSIKGSKAIALMKILHPFMGARRQEQIRVAIASYKSRKPGDNTRKLTREQVEEIRASKEHSEAVAVKFKVSGKTIREIRRRGSWKYGELPRYTHHNLEQKNKGRETG